MEKLFLLDAYALIYRAYYAFIKNPRINSKGLNTSAILGFVNTLEEVLRKENPTHIGIAFDPAGLRFATKPIKPIKPSGKKPRKPSGSLSLSSKISSVPTTSRFWRCRAMKPTT